MSKIFLNAKNLFLNLKHLFILVECDGFKNIFY